MLRDYAKKSTEEIAELKDLLRMAEDNDRGATRQLQELEKAKFMLMKDNEELQDKLEQYGQLCVQNEGYI